MNISGDKPNYCMKRITRKEWLLNFFKNKREVDLSDLLWHIPYGLSKPRGLKEDLEEIGADHKLENGNIIIFLHEI